MPEGLKPKDVEALVLSLNKAAQKAQEKGLKGVNKSISDALLEQELMFASDLDKKLAELDDYYDKEIEKAENNADLIALLEANKARAKDEAKTHDKIENLDFQEQLEMERLAGMESIGMAELAEEKKLEITKHYLQLRIDALKPLADAGDKDAAKQIQLMQASLNKLDMQKPAKGLKALADKALFDKIKNGFMKAGDSAEEAEKKTNNLLNAISKKAGTVAIVVGELQSAFGGLDDGLDKAMEAVGNIAQSFASGGPIGAAMSAASMVIEGFISSKARQAEIQREINRLQEDYNVSLRQQNYDLISSIDYARIFRDNLEALHWLIERGFISDVNYSAWDELNKHAKEANKNILIAQQNSDKAEAKGVDLLNELHDNDIWRKLNKSGAQIVDSWKNGVITTTEALRQLAASGIKGASDTADEIERADEETQKWLDTMEELAQQMDEFATGTSFDGFLSDAMNAISNMKDGISGLANFTEDALKNAILSSFKYQILAAALKPFYDTLADKFITDFDNLDEEWANDWVGGLEKELGAKGEMLNKLFDKLGIDFDKDTRKASEKGFATASQDSINDLTGIMTNIQSHTFQINGNVASMHEQMKSFAATYKETLGSVNLVLLETRAINKNTQELYPIREDIKAMREDINSLVIHGTYLKK